VFNFNIFDLIFISAVKIDTGFIFKNKNIMIPKRYQLTNTGKCYTYYGKQSKCLNHFRGVRSIGIKYSCNFCNLACCLSGKLIPSAGHLSLNAWLRLIHLTIPGPDIYNNCHYLDIAPDSLVR